MTRLIDWHVHVLPRELRGRPPASLMERETPYLQRAYLHQRVEEITERASAEAVREVMHANNVDIAVCFGQQWRDPDLCAESNAYVIEAVAASNGALRGLAVAQPLEPRSLDDVAKVLEHPGMLGVKVKPKWGGFSLADESVMAPLCELLMATDRVLLTHVTQGFHHSAGDNVADLIALVRRFPGLKVVAAHLGGFVDVYTCHPPIGRLLDNVWIDVSLPSSLSWVPPLLAQGGRDRYLYATDFPYGEPEEFLRQLGALDLDGEPVLPLLARNGERLLSSLEP